MKKIWIFAGEASGDLYGARLGETLRTLAAEKISNWNSQAWEDRK